jgi:hypothetical protein
MRKLGGHVFLAGSERRECGRERYDMFRGPRRIRVVQSMGHGVMCWDTQSLHLKGPLLHVGKDLRHR